MGNGCTNTKRWRKISEIEEEEEIEKISNQDRRVVDMKNKTVNMSHKRCTDMKNNRQIIFPINVDGFS